MFQFFATDRHFLDKTKFAFRAMSYVVLLLVSGGLTGFPGVGTAQAAESQIPYVPTSNAPLLQGPGSSGPQAEAQIASLGGICRLSKLKGVPRYTADDRYFLNGQEIIEIGSGIWGLRVEDGSYLRIERVGDYWVAKAKNGGKTYFGQTAASRLQSADGTKVLRWLPDRSETVLGEFSTTSYVKDNLFPYAAQVRQYNKDNVLLSETINYYEPRPDVKVSSRYGFEIRIAQRPKSALHKINGHNKEATSYGYTQGANGDWYLTSEKKYGSDVYMDTEGTILEGSALPATTYDFGQDRPQGWSVVASTVKQDDGKFPEAITVDLNGDGYEDLLTACLYQTANPCGKMAPGKTLYRGQEILSCNGNTKLCYQTDGNVVLYRIADHAALWWTNTAGRASTHLAMQGDGHLVLYNGSTPVWYSGTAGNPGAYLSVMDDCNLVIFKADGTPLAFSGTYGCTVSDNIGKLLPAQGVSQDVGLSQGLYLQAYLNSGGDGRTFTRAEAYDIGGEGTTFDGRYQGYLANSSEGFKDAQVIGIMASLRSGMADYDGDGLIDYEGKMKTGPDTPPHRYHWRNTGTGWAVTGSTVYGDYGFVPESITVDLNGDAYPDLLVGSVDFSDAANPGFYLQGFLNDGGDGARFTRAEGYNLGGVGDYYLGYYRGFLATDAEILLKVSDLVSEIRNRLADFDGDGLPDYEGQMKSSPTGGFSNYHWRNTGGGWAVTGSSVVAVNGRYPQAFAVDLNGDGFGDLLTAYVYTTVSPKQEFYLRAYLNNGGGTAFTRATAYDIGGGGDTYNGHYRGYLSWFNGTMTEAMVTQFLSSLRTRMADFDGDGLVDCETSMESAAEQNLASFHWRNTGAGWRVTASTVKTGFGEFPASISHDLNGDGYLDLLVARDTVPGGAMVKGSTLYRGQRIYSENGAAYLDHQTDGNLVLYRSSDRLPLWWTNTAGRATTNLVMQPDGNLVLYNGTGVVWHSNTYGNPNAYLLVQSDGNLVIYSEAGKALKCSGSSISTPSSTPGSLVSVTGDFWFSGIWQKMHMQAFLNNGGDGVSFRRDQTFDLGGTGDYAAGYYRGYLGDVIAMSATPSSFVGSVQSRLADYDGDGLVDYAGQMESGPGLPWTSFHWRNTGGGMRLEETDNGHAGRVVYQQPTRRYDASLDQVYGSPNQKVVLSQAVTSYDGLGGESTTTTEQAGFYTYVGTPGEVDGRGPKYVKTILPDGSYTVTLNHQGDGDVDDPDVPVGYLQGRPYETSVYDASGNLYQRARIEYGLRTDNAGYPQRKFVHVTNQYDEKYDGLTDPVVARAEYVTYDAFGNCTEQKNHGDIAYANDERVTKSWYAAAAGRYLVAPYKTETWSADLTGDWGLASRTETWYDGLGLGEVDKGLATQVRVENGSADAVSQKGYDAYGNVIWTKNPRFCAGEFEGFTSETEYDYAYHRYPISTKNALGQVVRTEYDNLMRVRDVIDANGAATRTTYDVFGRPAKVVRPGDSEDFPTERYDYWLHPTLQSWAMRILKLEAAGTNQYLATRRFCDGWDRVIQEKTDSGPTTGQYFTTDTYYDASGRVSKTSRRYLTTSIYYSPRDGSQKFDANEYDCLGRLTRQTRPVGGGLQTVYRGREQLIVDKNGHVTAVRGEGRKTIIRKFEGVYPDQGAEPYAEIVKKFARSGETVTDAQGNVKTTVLDMLGRVTSDDDPDRGTWTQVYDLNGNLSERTDAKGQVVRYAYDALDRLLRTDYADGTFAEHHYDEEGHGSSVGRLTREVYTSGSRSLVYDQRGRLTSETVTLDGESRTRASTYDPMDRVQAVTLPDGEVVTFTYDLGGALMSLTGTAPYVSQITYTPQGGVASLTTGNGITTTYDYYDTDGELDAVAGTYFSYNLRSIATSDPSLYNVAYNWDKMDNVRQKLDLGDPTYSEIYGYDDFDRLITATADVYGQKSYSYDTIDNLLAKDGLDYLYENADHVHAVTGKGTATYGYDANGNMITGHGRTYGYNPDGYLSGTSDGSSYAYFGDRRVMKTENGTTTYYFFSGYEEEVTPPHIPEIPDIILDNGDNRCVPTGSWEPSNAPRGFYGSDCLIDGTTRADVNTSVTWTPEITVEMKGDYEIYMWWRSGRNAPDAAPVEITTADGVVTLTVNQQADGSQWNLLGEYYFGAGDGQVRLLAADNGVTVADAVKFVYKGDPRAEPLVNIVKSYSADCRAVARRTTNEGLLYYHLDYLGSSSRITDESGILVKSIGYTPYGSTTYETGELPAKYRFTSLEQDATGLYASGSQYYDPDLGRFVSNGEQTWSVGGTELSGSYFFARNNPATLAGGSDPLTCFVAGTLVQTVDGLRPIEEIAAGDLVLAHDPATGERRQQKVLQTFVREAKELVVFLVAGTEIVTTPEHPFWVVEGSTGRWVDAGEVKTGMSFLLADGRVVEVTGAERRPGPETVYNMTVDEHNTYFVSDLRVLVHNYTYVNSNIRSYNVAVGSSYSSSSYSTSPSTYRNQNNNNYRQANSAASYQRYQAQLDMRWQMRKMEHAGVSYNQISTYQTRTQLGISNSYNSAIQANYRQWSANDQAISDYSSAYTSNFVRRAIEQDARSYSGWYGQTPGEDYVAIPGRGPARMGSQAAMDYYMEYKSEGLIYEDQIALGMMKFMNSHADDVRRSLLHFSKATSAVGIFADLGNVGKAGSAISAASKAEKIYRGELSVTGATIDLVAGKSPYLKAANLMLSYNQGTSFGAMFDMTMNQPWWAGKYDPTYDYRERSAQPRWSWDDYRTPTTTTTTTWDIMADKIMTLFGY